MAATRGKTINIPFEYGEEELISMLNRYRISLGWSWKRFFLVGIAEAIGKQGDNPDLVLEIANYLERRR